jgi:hypothetical protein
MNNNVIHQNMDTVKNIIFAAKVKGGKFFTHIAAKKYFKKNILTQANIQLNNKIIINGDYDIKAYGSMINGIKDYLNKLELAPNEVIMIHPFTPVEIVDVIKRLGLKIIFYTIDSDTLSLQKESFENMLNVQKPKLIIHYTINQLLEEITQEIEFVEKNKTELLIIDNNTSHNSEYFELINKMQSGAYYQLLSDNFQSQIINDLTGINVEKNSIYINLIFGKDLLTSITPKVIPNIELHNELADTLYQLLFNQEKQKGIVNSLRNSIIKQTLSSQKNMTNTQLNESFEQIFNRVKNDEIPDYIFELVNSLDIMIDSQDLILNKNLLENRNSKKLKIQNIIQNNQKESNLATIPKSCVFRDVTTFHIQTQDQKEWYNTLKYGGLVFYRLPYPHDDIFNSLDSNTDAIINDTLVSIL